MSNRAHGHYFAPPRFTPSIIVKVKGKSGSEQAAYLTRALDRALSATFFLAVSANNIASATGFQPRFAVQCQIIVHLHHTFCK
jgi:hypothetical protein